MNTISSTCVLTDRLDKIDFMYILGHPKHGNVQNPEVVLKIYFSFFNTSSSLFFTDRACFLNTRQSLISERSEGTTIYQSSPHASITSPRVSFHHSHNPLQQEGEHLSFNVDETFRGLDEFQEDPPPYLEETSWDGEDSELIDPTLTLLNQEHFQVKGVTTNLFTA